MARFVKTRCEHAEPILRVANIQTSLRYYVDVLGFRNAHWGSADFTCVTRDGAAVYLCRGDQGCAGTWAWIGVEDAAALYQEYQATGATIRQHPVNRPWGLEFQVEDPDGHVLRFGSEALTDRPSDSSAVSRLIRELERTRSETLQYFSLDARDLTRSYAPAKWSVRYILHHLADSETVFFERIRRVLSEPRPVLQVMDQDAWAKGLDYAQVPLEVARQVYGAVRDAIIYYVGVHYERSGHLEWVHSVDGVRTLRAEFDKVAAHNEHHLVQIRTALAPATGAS